jgi:phosphoesterase RecJ-like protein
MCADLLGYGVRPDKVARLIYENKLLSSIRLLGLAAGRAQSAQDGALVWSTLTGDDFAQAGAQEEETEGIVELLRSAKGVAVAILFVEDGDNRTKVSFRAGRGVDVSALAARFGGGGHPGASGCTIDAGLSQTQTMVLSAAAEACSESLG